MCNRSQIWSSWLPPPQLKDPTSGGWGGTLWQAARRAAQSTASARRGCRPAPLTLLCTRPERRSLPPGEAGCLSATAPPEPRPRPAAGGLCLPGLRKGRGSWGDEVIGVVTGSLQPSWRGPGESRALLGQRGGLAAMAPTWWNTQWGEGAAGRRLMVIPEWPRRPRRASAGTRCTLAVTAPARAPPRTPTRGPRLLPWLATPGKLSGFPSVHRPPSPFPPAQAGDAQTLLSDATGLAVRCGTRTPAPAPGSQPAHSSRTQLGSHSLHRK